MSGTLVLCLVMSLTFLRTIYCSIKLAFLRQWRAVVIPVNLMSTIPTTTLLYLSINRLEIILPNNLLARYHTVLVQDLSAGISNKYPQYAYAIKSFNNVNFTRYKCSKLFVLILGHWVAIQGRMSYCGFSTSLYSWGIWH